MPSPADSMVARAADQEAEHAARMATPWLLMWRSERPEDHALAMCWMGRHLSEMLWRFELAMQVDRLAAQLNIEGTPARCRHQGEVDRLPEGK